MKYVKRRTSYKQNKDEKPAATLAKCLEKLMTKERILYAGPCQLNSLVIDPVFFVDPRFMFWNSTSNNARSSKRRWGSSQFLFNQGKPGHDVLFTLAIYIGYIKALSFYEALLPKVPTN